MGSQKEHDLRACNDTGTTKHPSTSTTLIVNGLLAIIGGLNLVVQDGVVDYEGTKVLLLIAAIANLVLRYKTNKPIEPIRTSLKKMAGKE